MSKVDAYISKATQWKDEIITLRGILLDCGLAESLKWGKPCYSHENANVVIIQPFKSYFALLFFKGILMEDPENVLQKTGENTRVGRQMRFENVEDIKALETVIKSYINEAIEVEKKGLTVELDELDEQEYPEELIELFDIDPAFKNAFDALTPGRQRGYLMHFNSAKQSKTRYSRIEKSKSKIFEGKGFNER